MKNGELPVSRHSLCQPCQYAVDRAVDDLVQLALVRLREQRCCVLVRDELNHAAEGLSVLALADGEEHDAERAPRRYHAPFRQDERAARAGDTVHDDHEAAHQHRDAAHQTAGRNLVRTRHIRLLFAQDEEGDRDHAVGEAAAEVACIADPDHHDAACERREHGEDADEDERIDRSLVFGMQLGENARDHVGLRHRVDGARAADHERVPRGDDAAHTADDDDLGHDRGLEGERHRVRRDQTRAGLRSGDRARVHDQTDRNDDECVEQDRENDRQDEHAADLFRRNVDLLRRLRDNVKADKVERRDDRDREDGLDDIAAADLCEHLTVQIVHRTVDDRCDDEQDTRAADNDGEDGLELGSRLCAHDVDEHDAERDNNRDDQPRSVNVKACDRVQVSLEEARPQIGDDGRERARFKARNADIAENDRPCAHERAGRTHRTMAPDVLAAALRHGRRQLCIGQTDEKDHDAANHKAERRAEDAALLDPAARGDDPAPADHCAERDDEDVPCAEHLVKFGLLLFHDALPSSAVEYLARDLLDERRRAVRPEQAAVDEQHRC